MNNDQGWIMFVAQRFHDSPKEEHRRMIRYIELKVTEVEENQAQRPVLPRGIYATRAKAKAKAASRAASSELPSVTEALSSNMDDAEELVSEPDPSYSVIMTSNQELQERVQFLESALHQVIQHAGTGNPILDTTENLL